MPYLFIINNRWHPFSIDASQQCKFIPVLKKAPFSFIAPFIYQQYPPSFLRKETPSSNKILFHFMLKIFVTKTILS